MNCSKNQSRHNARRYAVQALYQWIFNETPTELLVQEFVEECDYENTDIVYLKNLIAGVIEQSVTIDEFMATCLDRDIKALNPVELSILRLAVYELQHHPEIPYRVVINEALELTKEFGAEEGYKYVNAVLDALVKGKQKIK